MGAHNQRGEVRVQVRYRKFFWIEDLIRMVEESASCEVYALLKRQDEKFVTEKAYSNPMFVEDVVREIAHRLGQNRQFHLVLGGIGKLRVHPQPFGLRLYRIEIETASPSWAAFSTPGFRRLSFLFLKNPAFISG